MKKAPHESAAAALREVDRLARSIDRQWELTAATSAATVFREHDRRIQAELATIQKSLTAFDRTSAQSMLRAMNDQNSAVAAIDRVLAEDKLRAKAAYELVAQWSNPAKFALPDDVMAMLANADQAQRQLAAMTATVSAMSQPLIAQISAAKQLFEQPTLRTLMRELANIDQLASLSFASTWDADRREMQLAAIDAIISVERQPEAQPADSQWPRLTLGDALALFSILLSFLMYTRQGIDSEQATAQVLAAIQNSQAQTLAAIESAQAQDEDHDQQILALLNQLLDQMPVVDGPQCVVHRPARVRTERGGGRIIAMVGPKQVVTCLDHEGKWLRIRYHDWQASRDVEGWVLKKHVRRVPLTANTPAE